MHHIINRCPLYLVDLIVAFCATILCTTITVNYCINSFYRSEFDLIWFSSPSSDCLLSSVFSYTETFAARLNDSSNIYILKIFCYILYLLVS